MKITFRYLMVFIIIFPLMSDAQTIVNYTPYDFLPGMMRSYKPAWDENFPEWARKMYTYPVNIKELDRDFNQFILHNPAAKSPLIRYYKIWRHALDPWVLPDGSIELPSQIPDENYPWIDPGYHSDHLMKLPANGSDWSFTGPVETYWLNETGTTNPLPSCPWQVNVYSFDVAATNPDILFCGTETGFVNKSTDKGFTWEPSGAGYPFGGGITAVAIHPNDPQTVYAAGGNQVHRTTDGGVTWSPLLNPGNLFYADRLRIDPMNPQKIFAAASGGLFVSTDGGSNWTKKWNTAAYDVEIRPNDDNQVFALVKSGSVFSIVQSTDGGASFQTQSTFPTNVTDAAGGLLAMTPANPDLLMAILLSANDTPYLIKGQYSGASWNWSLQATGGTSALQMDNGQGYFDLVLDISPVNQNVLLVGTTTLFKSLNGGISFSAVGGYYGNFDIHPDIQDIRMMPNGDTWVSTDGGMNLTTDNFGIQMNYHVRVNGLMGSDFWGFDQGWNEDIVVGGRYHNGNTALADFYYPKALRMGGAESPTGWVLQGKSRHAAFDDLGNGWILPPTAESKYEGRFIFSKYPNMDEYGGRRGNLVHHPYYYETLYLGEGTGFWRSRDMGVTWDLLYDFPARIRYLQISPTNPEVIYADVVGAGLVRSGDGGVTWVQKPSLTSPPNGTSSWKGKLFFAISPYDENTIYATLQNGTWSADIGKVFRSVNGGDSWEDWTGTLSEYMKCLVVQPSADGTDLVYLFTNSTAGKTAKVFYRKPGMADWLPFSNGYPAGTVVNMALPFFRDSKLRVGGNGGVWESPLADTAFIPIIRPWAPASDVACMTDTIQLDDHSMVNHTGTTWEWTITPAPVWIDNPSLRNPRLVLGYPGSYDVSLTVTRNGQSWTKSIDSMITAHNCPSIYDCNNPADLPKSQWSLLYVDSEEPNDPGLAVMSFDNNPSTLWHTRWTTGNDPYPHEIQVKLGQLYRISRFTLLNRQDGENGRIREYELYITEDTLNWGQPVSKGTWENTSAPQRVTIDPPATGRYFRLVALSEVNGNPWASVAELELTGCVEWPAEVEPAGAMSDIRAFPIPAGERVSIPLPSDGTFNYSIFSFDGKLIGQGVSTASEEKIELDVKSLNPGSYLIVLKNHTGQIFRVRMVKH